MKNITEFRNAFSFLRNNPECIYFDNAATSLKPDCIVEAMNKYYFEFPANIHRGFYPIAEKATKAYEDARVTIANFLGADPDEIIFTSGSTEALNGVFLSLTNAGLLTSSTRVLTSEMEHSSVYGPLMQLHPKIDYISSDNNGNLDLADLPNETDLLVLSGMSNVFGTTFPLQSIIESVKSKVSIIDASQLVVHEKIDVKKINCDVLVFSGHKLYGPTGIGVLYIKKEAQSKITPWFSGGGSLSDVSKNSISQNIDISAYEAGTKPIAEAIGLAAAVDFINSFDLNIAKQHEYSLTEYALSVLSDIKGLSVFHAKDGGPVLSFTIDGVHAHDIAYDLGLRNICVRGGYHCAYIAHEEVTSNKPTVRLSFAAYNTKSEIDIFVNALREVIAKYK